MNGAPIEISLWCADVRHLGSSSMADPGKLSNLWNPDGRPGLHWGERRTVGEENDEEAAQ